MEFNKKVSGVGLRYKLMDQRSRSFRRNIGVGLMSGSDDREEYKEWIGKECVIGDGRSRS